MIHMIVMTWKRFQHVPHPWYTDTIVLVIPNPFSSTNVGAVWQPFQFEVFRIFESTFPLFPVK